MYLCKLVWVFTLELVGQDLKKADIFLRCMRDQWEPISIWNRYWQCEKNYVVYLHQYCTPGLSTAGMVITKRNTSTFTI